MNCTDGGIGYNLTLSDQSDNLNGTMLFLVDNSGLFPTVSHPTQLINLILEYSVVAQISEESKAKLFLICSLTGVVILIMVVLAVILNCKIKIVDRQIEDWKRAKLE